VINRIRDIRREKGMTLAALANACRPPTTAQTIGRLETGMRNLSIKWMDRIAGALGVDPEMLVRSEANARAQIVAQLGVNGAEALAAQRDALLPSELAGDAVRVVLAIEATAGEYRTGDQLWLRQIAPEDAARAINRDVLVPRRGGRFAFGRLIDRNGDRVGVLPVGAGQKQLVIDDPAWIAVAEMLVRKL
jgi:transcriptional regulator with XRE-family HTH domain